MENLSRLVSASLAQNGVSTALNHQRLEWSRWFRCESSFSVLLAPSKPGIFALGEEMIPEGQDRKRMLGLFEIAETDDLGLSLGRLFLPRSPLREKLECGRSFARFTVIEDASERASAYAALRNWIDQSAETASGLTARDQNKSSGADRGPQQAQLSTVGAGDLPVGENVVQSPDPLINDAQPSFSFPWGTDAPNHELRGEALSPAPLPSGF